MFEEFLVVENNNNDDDNRQQRRKQKKSGRHRKNSAPNFSAHRFVVLVTGKGKHGETALVKACMYTLQQLQLLFRRVKAKRHRGEQEDLIA